MKKKILISMTVIFLLAGLGVSLIHAHGIEIYGFSDFLFSYGKYRDFFDSPYKASSFAQNRTNLILSSELYKKWDFFLNLEFTGEFRLNSTEGYMGNPDSNTSKGNLELEEAWTSYTLSDKLKIKVGVFLSPFGSFNVIQDKSPSYISVRPPMIYDDEFRSMSPIHIIPDRSNLEVSGKFRWKKSLLEYYLYFGNGLGADSKGNDINLSKSIGSRLAYTYDGNLKLGYSVYYDNAYIESLGGVHSSNQVNGTGLYLAPQAGLPQPPGGGLYQGEPLTAEEKRFLWSFDFNYSFSKFNINGEYFRNHNKNKMGRKFFRQFYYVNLNWEVVDKVRLYVERDNYKDRNFSDPDDLHYFLNRGMYKTLYGINFQPNWRAAIKAEIQHYTYGEGLKIPYTVFVTSLSVLF